MFVQTYARVLRDRFWPSIAPIAARPGPPTILPEILSQIKYWW